MNTFRAIAVGILAVMAGLVLTTSAGHAQIKVLPWDPDADKEQVKGVSFVDIAAPSDYQHGALVSVTLKNNDRITGTLVRSDRRDKKLYIRTRPGEPPMAVSVDNISKIQKGVREMKKKGKGGVGFAGLTQRAVIEAEIHPVTIHHGTEETIIQYSAPTLSREEQKALMSLEAAENEMARVNNLMAMRTVYLHQERMLQMRQAEAVREIYEGAAAQARRVAHNEPLSLSQNGFVRLLLPAYPAVATTLPPPVLTPEGLIGPSPVAFASVYTAAPITLPMALPEPPSTPPAARAALKELTPKYIAQVRQDLANARAATVYEDGRVIAVVVSTNKGTTTPAVNKPK
jgi:hypothetical protein